MFPWHDPVQPLRVDQFMHAALHDPARGYYAKNIHHVGSRGDFSTSATLAPAFAKAISSWCQHALTESSCRHLIELGPGNGNLAAAILSHLPRRKRPQLHLVERSAPLRAIQQATIGRRRAHWHHSIEDALTACRGHAVLFSNEFFDAFPARRFRLDPSGWTEQWITPTSSEWRPAPSLPESTLFDQSWPPGQIIEVHESCQQWLQQLAGHWHHGRMLAIDYGATAEKLYHRQPHGSLRAYFHHQRLTGPECFHHPGHQDLTCDINFSDLISWSKPFASPRSLTTQTEFLAPHLDPSHPADQFIADPHGAGNAFLCLDLEVEHCPKEATHTI